MARPLRFAPLTLCLCVSTALAGPALASPYGPPAHTMKLPSSKPHATREAAPAPAVGIGLPSAPLGPWWWQRRIQVVEDPLRTDPDTTPTTPFIVVRSTAGQPLVLAVTPPGEPLSMPARRRVSPGVPFTLGVFTFATSYLVTGVGARALWRDCTRHDGDACRPLASTMMIPLAGPILIAHKTHEPRYYAHAAVQGVGLLLAVIGLIALMNDRHRHIGPHGVRIAKHTELRPDAGPGGAQLALHTRF